MKPYRRLVGTLLMVAVVALAAFMVARGGAPEPPESCEEINRVPELHPELDGVVVPPNIAPLNFQVNLPGEAYYAELSGKTGGAVKAGCRDGVIRIPRKAWSALLEANRGGRVSIKVSVRDEGGRWGRYKPITLDVAREPIDPYLIYRRLRPVCNTWSTLGIYQRDLRSFAETRLLTNTRFGEGCVNCHAFRRNDPGDMVLHTRGGTAGSATILVRDGIGERVNTQTQFGLTGYTSWHPSGKVLVCAVCKVRQLFHTARKEVRDVFDVDSTLVYYLPEEDKVGTDARLCRKDRLESYPCWSPDGSYLYFSSAKKLWPDEPETFPPRRYDEVRYDLMRASYDAEANRWGEPELVVSASKLGGSITQARISPAGRFLVCSVAEYGCFPIFLQSSDLWLVDLETGEPRRLAINSDETDSWHCWSSNGRWLVFSSKRGNGLFSRPYFSYVAEDGAVSKPFVLPQEDPRFYESCIMTYNVPELVTGPVTVRGEELASLIRTPLETETVTSASPRAEARGGRKSADDWNNR